jgi:hypothetical protein
MMRPDGSTTCETSTIRQCTSRVLDPVLAATQSRR